MRRPSRNSSEMYPLIEAYLGGSQTREAFCRDHDLPVATLAYWRAKYGREHLVTSGFTEVRPEPSPTEKAHVEILYPNGIRIRLFSAVTPTYVVGLVAGQAG